jgi:hypothetical protein
MAKHSADMLRCIRDLDHETAKALWKQVRPNSTQPENDYQAILMLHYARASLWNMPEHLRLYSHCWLRDEGVPSPLPDKLKPKAERMYPVGFRAVGVASIKTGGEKTAFNYAVQKVMSDAVLEAYADGHINQPHIVKARILEKRAEFKKKY